MYAKYACVHRCRYIDGELSLSGNMLVRLGFLNNLAF